MVFFVLPSDKKENLFVFLHKFVSLYVTVYRSSFCTLFWSSPFFGFNHGVVEPVLPRTFKVAFAF